MKQLILISLIAVGAFAAEPLLSQTSRVPRTTRQELQGIKEFNQKMLDQQTAALKKLEEMQKESSQLRIFVRRN